MRRSPYQILPDLLPDEYDALKASIAERGVDVPNVVDQDGNTLDGHHRQRACDELGRDCPTEVRCFASEAEKFEFILRANCRRRQLSRKQKEKLIEVYLVRDPQIADNHLGTLIGVSKNTVAKARARLETTCQIDKFAKLRGRDGKDRPTYYKRIVANTSKEVENALKAIKHLPDDCEGKVLDVITAQRRAQRNKKRVERVMQPVPALASEDIRLYQCRFQDLESTAGIQPASAHLILTDIPYGKAFLPQITELAALASRLLVEGGLFVMHSGQCYLPEVLHRLGEHLTYRWTYASTWNGDCNLIHPLQLTSQWKPILVYSKGEWVNRSRWCDLSRVVTKEKDYHPWQQPLVEVETLVRYFSGPSDLVVDPCGGGFTTAVACLRQQRRFVGCDCDEHCVADGQRRLAKEWDERSKLLTDLRIWIEDTEELGGNQQVVRAMWQEHSGLPVEQMDLHIHLLAEPIQAIWRALPVR